MNNVRGSFVFGACLTLWALPASADMGPMIVVPLGGILLLQLALLLVLLLPGRMKGRRLSAAGIFFGVLLVPWLISLGRPIDSFSDFYLLLVASVLTFGALVMYYRT